MTKVLLTGGTGFIAAHILDQLLLKGHDVVTTARSEEKAERIRKAYPGKKVQVVIVPEIAEPGAFDEVVKIPGLEVVFHTASPLTFSARDGKKDVIDPAVLGTTGILKAIAESAPTVKRVVVTSSFAAHVDEPTMEDSNTIVTEESWNPIKPEDIDPNSHPITVYRASKTFAEQAAWAFVKDPANGAKFELCAVNPPLVFGPLAPSQSVSSRDAVNLSMQRVADLVQGKWKTEIPPTGVVYIWMDVRDVATAHVKAGLEVPEAAGQRLLVMQGPFANRDIFEIVKANFPELADKMPLDDVKGGEGLDKVFRADDSATREILGIKGISLEQSIVDSVKSLLALGA